VAINVRQQKSVEKEKPYPPSFFSQFLGIKILGKFNNILGTEMPQRLSQYLITQKRQKTCSRSSQHYVPVSSVSKKNLILEK
jgi:hypothetical protein